MLPVLTASATLQLAAPAETDSGNGFADAATVARYQPTFSRREC
jgi:hypothetical protein